VGDGYLRIRIIRLLTQVFKEKLGFPVRTQKGCPVAGSPFDSSP
jgi:hypothetical protein